MSDQKTFKPCPFCGCTNIQTSSDGGCKHFSVFCTECGVSAKDWGLGR